jgi:hypothetical protein
MATRVKPVLVTGSPRSGTTFTGRMLTLTNELYYVHEPFNPHSKGEEARGRLSFERHFTYVTADNGASYKADVQRMVEGRYDLAHALKSVRRPRQLVRAFARRREFDARRKVSAPLIKDPIALMAAPWLVSTFDLNCVVTIRHPGAFVASIDRLEWDSKPFRWALSQPTLMRDVLHPFETELRELESADADVVERAAMAWKLHHFVIRSYRERFPGWTFLRHEDVSRKPVPVFEKVYDRLGLTWTPAIAAAIDAQTGTANPNAAEGKDKALRLDSRAALGGWKSRVTQDEIDRIRARVAGVVEAFYDDDEW